MVYNSGGFFALKTAEDLRQKCRADLEAMRARPADSLLAFNFFVTARHVFEWKFGSKAGAALIESIPVMRVCRHLGDGAKHFVLCSSKHTQVHGLKQPDGAFDSAAFDSSAFETDELQVKLDPSEAAAASLSQTVGVVKLGTAVMAELNAAF